MSGAERHPDRLMPGLGGGRPRGATDTPPEEGLPSPVIVGAAGRQTQEAKGGNPVEILTARNGVPTSFRCEHCTQRWTGTPDDVPVRERIRHARRECLPI